MHTKTSLAPSATPILATTVVRTAVFAAALAGGFAQAADTAPASDARATLIAQDASCRNCGVVQSVVRVQRPGQTKGIAGTPVTPGMAIGGVVGGLVGNQVGHGSGNTAATVLGAAGGAYAGHAIEKNRSQRTAYVMHIRMADGSMRTIEQGAALRKGSHVVVEGNRARLSGPRNSAHG